MISAEIVMDSISPKEIRLTTLKLVYPRFIHAEFMTHRVFSRNASSSRAEPVEKHIARIEKEYAQPIFWGKNQPGMQAQTEIEEEAKSSAKDAWRLAKELAIQQAKKLNELGCHKQIVNRILEPFSHIHVVVTATEWDNFFDLRLHRDAEPHIYELAYQIKKELKGSAPKLIDYGEWHLPFITKDERSDLDEISQLECSVARCARVSYLTHDNKKPNPIEDSKLYLRLVGGVPIHASPTEHQATPMVEDKFYGNFRGWLQYRKLIEANKN